MSLDRYFKPVPKRLPDPEGPLSQTLPSVTIKAANEAVLAATSKSAKERPSKRGHYVKLTGVQQAQVAFAITSVGMITTHYRSDSKRHFR